MSLDRQLDMIHLNIAVTALCYLFINHWKNFLGEGHTYRILNLSSVVAKLPTPFQAVYSGTKAYIQSFTVSLAEELYPKFKGQLTATALLPGFTHTPLLADIKAQESVAVKFLQAEDQPDYVAKNGYKAMMQGKLYVISGWMNNFLTFTLGSVLPTWLMLKVMKLLIADYDQLVKPGSIAQKGLDVERGNTSEISMQ